jgi:hypothetical protein
MSIGVAYPLAEGCNDYEFGHVAELVGIEGGVVSGVINLESSGA